MRSAVGDEYDQINEYDYIDTGHQPLPTMGMQRDTGSPTSRPLPTIPLTSYEPLNFVATKRTASSKRVSRRKMFLTFGICGVVIVLIVAVVIAVAVTLSVLNNPNDESIGKLQFYIILIMFCP